MSFTATGGLGPAVLNTHAAMKVVGASIKSERIKKIKRLCRHWGLPMSNYFTMESKTRSGLFLASLIEAGVPDDVMARYTSRGEYSIFKDLEKRTYVALDNSVVTYEDLYGSTL